MAPIVIVTPPLPLPAEHRLALEEGCRRAAHTPCQASPVEPRGPYVRAVWVDADTARIELHPGGTASVAEQRVLRFRTTDRDVDRWETLGVVAAALAVSRPAAEEDSQGGPDASPEPISPHEAHGWFALGAAGGTNGDAHLGGAADAGLNLGAIPLELSVSASYAVAPELTEGIRVHWFGFSGALGTSLRWTAPDLLLRGRMGPRAQRTEAVLHGTSSRDSGTRWLLGFSGALDAYWPATSPVAGWLGLEAWQNGGGTALVVDGLRVDSVPAWGATGRIGLVWQFGGFSSP